jgi:arylsulfatase A-like enzyme
MFGHDLRYTPEGYLEDVMKYMPPDDLIKNKITDYSPWERHRFTGIACLDHQTGIIISKLEELGLYDNTIIIYMADHNVEPGKSTCYENGNRVPLIIRWPGRIEGGSICNSIVQSVDLIPTLLAAAGIDILGDTGMDGKSMLSLFNEPGSEIRDYVYLEAGYCRGITDGKYKYIAFRPPQEAISLMESGKLDMAVNHMNILNQAHSQIAMEKYPGYFDQDQLYDLENDPYEQVNLASDPAYRVILQQMQEELRKYLVTFDHPFNLEEIPFMNTEQYRQLADKAVARGTDWIPWLQRDHGGITWPPTK